MASSQPRDYRRMLYRLDRATKYESIPALVQHMMEETVLDGILELRMVTSSSAPGQSSQPPQLRLPSTFISFRREGRDVNAVALYGPRTSRSSPSGAPGRASSPTPRSEPLGPTEFSLEVKKRYAPRTTLVWVFSPLVQRLLTEGASTVLFECRSYLAGSDVAREIRAADARAAAAESAAVRAAAVERDAHYHHQQQMHQQQAQYGVYDPNMQQWQPDPYAAQQGYHSHPGVVAPAWNPNVTYPLADATYLDGYGNPVNPQPEHYYAPPTSYDPASVSPPIHIPQRPSTSPRSGSQSQSRTHRLTPSPPQSGKEEDPAMELLTRRAPFKRMLGYAGKQHDGSTAVYELADEVAAIAFTDGVSGIGMAGVQAMGSIGRGVRQTSPSATTRRL
ncbi:hypothetical protein FRC07_003209 [Ceratobasidium sp. 392]|nr:hypothetical protein FRC07_003209 [Ceratobasidium sp. 392]